MPPKLQSILRAPQKGARFLRDAIKKNVRLAVVLGVAIFVAWFLRAFWQPWAVVVRVHLAELALAAFILYRLKKALEVRHWRNIGLGSAAVAAIVWFVYVWGASPWAYVTDYVNYRRLDMEIVDQLPITGHERVEPLDSIRVKVHDSTSAVADVAPPDFVRLGRDYVFTLGVEPSQFFGRLLEHVESVIVVPATVDAERSGEQRREPAAFPHGEGLFLSANALTATIKTLGPLRFWSYQPTDVKYVKDGDEWVQVVCLQRWRGILFPRPEFGGVVVMRQKKVTPLVSAGYWANVLFGDGEWVPPEKVGKKPYLVGQNLVPEAVVLYQMECLRFRRGLLAPFPGFHGDDIRVPKMRGEQNQQPYVVYAETESGAGKLWLYCGLEPWLPGRSGLVESVFVPGDGIGPTLVVPHDQQNLLGSSVALARVPTSRQWYDWNNSCAAEPRPFIRSVRGKRQLFWLSTIVTKKNAATHIGATAEAKAADHDHVVDYIAGSPPEVVLVSSNGQDVFWLESRNPDDWVAQIERGPQPQAQPKPAPRR